MRQWPQPKGRGRLRKKAQRPRTGPPHRHVPAATGRRMQTPLATRLEPLAYVAAGREPHAP